MDDEFGTPTADALREVDEMCPGSDPASNHRIASRRPWFEGVAGGVALGLGLSVLVAGLTITANNVYHWAADSVPCVTGWVLGDAYPIKPRADLLPVSPLSQVPVGTIVQSAGSNLAWVKIGPSQTEWKSLPPEDPRLPPSTQRPDR